MNSGKLFERQFRKSCSKVDGLFYYRFKDSPSSWMNGENTGIRFTNDNICDVMLYKKPTLYLLELKAHGGSSLPFSCIRKNQIDGLLDASSYNGVVAGIVCYFTDKKRCFFLDIVSLRQFQLLNTRKSIPLLLFEQQGLEIPIKELRVNVEYCVENFFNCVGGLHND